MTSDVIADRRPSPTGSSGRPPVRSGVAARGRGTRRGDAVLVAAGVGLGASVALGILSTRSGLGAPGGRMLMAGTLTALAGTYLCLVLLLLISRVPWLEREIGHDRMVWLHRRVAPYSLLLILAHVALTTISYAQAASTGFVAELWHLVTRSRWMLPAAAAFVLMMALGVMSARVIRRRMKYETWWVSHLYFYIAVALSFGHQVVLGPMFVGHVAVRDFWAGLYLIVAATIVYSRVLRPLTTSVRHRLTVAAVVPEAGDVVSIYLGGADLDLLKVRGGQFFQWRFLTREWWWQAHPYSLSASPNPAWLRITVKDLGDQSSMLHRLRPGTRVWVEGPYGVFTASARHGETVTAIAAGVGITPIRAVLEDLPRDTSVTLLYRIADVAEAALRAELEHLVAERGWTLHYLDGPRGRHPITPEHLTALAPELAASDVYLCGPDEFTGDVRRAVAAAGVEPRRVHHEAFSF